MAKIHFGTIFVHIVSEFSHGFLLHNGREAYIIQLIIQNYKSENDGNTAVESEFLEEITGKVLVETVDMRRRKT